MQSQSLTDSLGIEDSTTGLKIAQAITPVDSLLTDTIPTKQPTLLDQVKYNAKEYVRINRKENKLILYDQAELYYQGMELKAGIIILDYKINEVTAGRIPDSLAILFKSHILSKSTMRFTPTQCDLILTPRKP